MVPRITTSELPVQSSVLDTDHSIPLVQKQNIQSTASQKNKFKQLSDHDQNNFIK